MSDELKKLVEEEYESWDNAIQNSGLKIDNDEIKRFGLMCGKRVRLEILKEFRTKLTSIEWTENNITELIKQLDEELEALNG